MGLEEQGTSKASWWPTLQTLSVSMLLVLLSPLDSSSLVSILWPPPAPPLPGRLTRSARPVPSPAEGLLQMLEMNMAIAFPASAALLTVILGPLVGEGPCAPTPCPFPGMLATHLNWGLLSPPHQEWRQSCLSSSTTPPQPSTSSFIVWVGWTI